MLLDEDITRRLKGELLGHEALTVAEMGWQGEKNGELLTLADTAFDVRLTVDRNMRYQQNWARLQRLAVVVLPARSTDINALRPLAPQVLVVLKTVRPGTVT